MIKAIFLDKCPNCLSEISDYRLSLGLPCENCISDADINGELNKTKVIEYLNRNGKLKYYADYVELNNKVNDVNSIFKKVIGADMWGAQVCWTKRVLQGRSFAIAAPTGMGKTTFGLIISLFLAKNNNYKCYILLPTALLVQQVVEKIMNFNTALNFNVGVVYFHSLMGKKEKNEQLKLFQENKFQILITTSSFLARKYELVENLKFDFVFVDDVDSFVRKSKNVDRVLELIGFDKGTIQSAYDSLKVKNQSFENSIKKPENATLIISGASIRARRSKKIKLFKLLLNFEIGHLVTPIRNIEDLYVTGFDDIKSATADIIRKLGNGALIFVPMDKTSEFAIELNNYLKQEGFKCESYIKPKRNLLKDFQQGVYHVLIGMASYRSPLARGIDLPETIRYAVFCGVPKAKISFDLSEFTITKALLLLNNLRDFCPESQLNVVDKYLLKLKRYLAISKPEQDKIAAALEEKTELEGISEKVRLSLERIKEFINKLLTDENIVDKLRQSPHHSLNVVDGKAYLLVPDPVAYIQASGRTSRMYPGGISKGLSVVIVDDERAFNGLKKQLQWYEELITWRDFSSVDIDGLVKTVDNDRKNILAIKSGEIKEAVKRRLKTALLVVESPTKARTISYFFGSPHRRTIGNLTVYETILGDLIINVTATGGHLYDLIVGRDYHGIKILDGNFVPIYVAIKTCKKCREQYTIDEKKCPDCGNTLTDKLDIVNNLVELAKEVDEVYIATDADSEGEKIAWDVYLSISPYVNVIKRLEFHEVTKKAILNAFSNPRDINIPLVESQIVRRVEDRWIGFELSQKLWSAFNNRKTLSAGRVQTTVLGWIVERTKNIRKLCHELFLVKLENGLSFQFKKEKMSKKDIKDFISDLSNKVFKVETMGYEETQISPYPPYATDSLLRDAFTILKFSVSETMRFAQTLFETGFITYHRTDSTRVSSAGIGVAKDYIVGNFPAECFKARVWAKTEEGAHECIRPTKPFDRKRIQHLHAIGALPIAAQLTYRHLSLYDLIFKRFIASQMREIIVQRQKIRITTDDISIEKDIPINILQSGFNLIKPYQVLNEVKDGEYKVVSVEHRRVPDQPLFGQGEVVDYMKKKSIGRPSTYMKIIDTVLSRKYVVETKRKKLIATPLGFKVYDFLNSKYSKFVSEETTRELEEKMNMVEIGKQNYQDVLLSLYCQIEEALAD